MFSNIRKSATALLTFGVVMTVCTACRTRPSNPGVSATPLTFLVVGDWGDVNVPNLKDQRAVAQVMAKVAESVPISFIVSTGDNFYYDTNTNHPAPAKPPFNVFFEDVYTNRSLRNLPWYLTLGNHDYRTNDYDKAEIAYTTSPDNVGKRWKLLNNYYAVTNPQASALLLFLDSTPIAEPNTPTGQDPKAQVDWLKTILTGATNQWKLAFGHHPILQVDEADGRTPCRPTAGGMSSVGPVLMENHVNAYFCGHIHALEYLLDSDREGNKLHCFISGGGGSNLAHVICPKTSDDFWAIRQHGFIQVSLGADRMVATYWSSNGKKLETVVVKR